MKQEMSGWQWHQLDHMQIICNLVPINNHEQLITRFFTGQMLFLMPNQQRQSTESKKLLWSKKCTFKWMLFAMPPTNDLHDSSVTCVKIIPFPRVGSLIAFPCFAYVWLSRFWLGLDLWRYGASL